MLTPQSVEISDSFIKQIGANYGLTRPFEAIRTHNASLPKNRATHARFAYERKQKVNKLKQEKWIIANQST